ncbi:MAG: CPBP family intramembrane metalloprotease [Coleofasciculaceae cyanobacterium SM2_1_6]|nr:CPBP family intramembrane metalloprotease [Coleofasciculaceae cyanobacterium SM2_1_6]
MKFNPQIIAHYPVSKRLGIFVSLLLLVWLPLAAPIYLLVADQNLVSILTLVLLYLEFVILLRWWGRVVYQEPRLLTRYGLEASWGNGQLILLGLAIGVALVTGMFLFQGWWGWLRWQAPGQNFLQIVLEGLLMSLAIGTAEELLFRGWLWDELRRDYSLRTSLVVNTLIFATLHFLKPLEAMLASLPQFPGLILLGLALIWAKQRSNGKLGLAIGLHGGLVWGYYLINVGNLITYTGTVSDWITGVGKNPLAGLVGLGFLGITAGVMRGRSTQT